MWNFHEIYIFIFYPESFRFIVQMYVLQVNYDGRNYDEKYFKIIY